MTDTDTLLPGTPKAPTDPGLRWYDLFSRGTRDWLRHNEKVRDAARRRMRELATEAGVLSGAGERTVQVPVKFLEHYRFRLRRDEREGQGVGQGEVKSGDVLKPGDPTGGGQGRGASGSGEGGLEFVLEFKVDEMVDWLWEELALPNLKPKSEAIQDDEYVRQGWDKRGARARLDRRRSLKEAIKRRVVQPDGPAFTNDDLRYRQLVRRPRPSTRAVVFFALDVSSSVTDQERRLAKTFFFWALQGLRRQYQRIETVFVAHTVRAWEFQEEEFFQARAHGGTVASTAFSKILELIDERYDPSRYNIYVFYASDGENFADDRQRATDSLEKLGQVSNAIGYLETGRHMHADYQTETSRLFERLAAHGLPLSTYPLAEEEHVWAAIRHFFRKHSVEAA